MVRICTVCKKQMIEGYCYENGEKYYCDDVCLSRDFTDEEASELYDNDALYWTIWEE